MKNAVSASCINNCRKEVIRLQTELISRPAFDPGAGGSGEYDKAVFLEKELKKCAFDKILRMDAADKRAKNGARPNLAAVIYGKNRKRTLWFMAHMDTVPANAKEWKTDPFKAVVKGDKIYGRGAEDNNQGIISTLLAARLLKESGVTPQVNIGLLFVSDEEIDSVYGIRHVLKKHGSVFTKNDSFIIPDFPTPEGCNIEVAEKHLLWLRFETAGKEGHAAFPDKGINAAEAGMRLALNLKEALTKKFNKKDPIFNPPSSTFVVTKRTANVENINNIPGRDVFYMDCRVLSCYTIKEVMAVVSNTVKSIEKRCKVKIKVRQETLNPSYVTDKKAPVAKCLHSAIKNIYGKTPFFQGVGGVTVAAFLREKGFPCVVTGRADAVMHTAEEYSKISNTLWEIKLFSYIMAQYGLLT